MTIYWTSDTHIGHRNVIVYSKRPFRDVDHMNETLIANWNSRVKPEDTIYHLGDFAMGPKDKFQSYLDRLNGHKILIAGNHDKRHTRELVGWESVHDDLEIRVNGTLIVLHHYGKRVWNRVHHGALMLYGHSHGNLPGDSQSLDVGVDCWNYFPVTLDQIRRRMAALPKHGWVDHHQP